MKNVKNLLGYLVAILLTFYVTKTYFCTPSTITEPPTAHIEDCVVPVCKENCDTAKAIIPLKEVAELYHGFESTVKPFENPEKMDDESKKNLQKLLVTRGVWFDYDHFKEYLSVIDKNAKDAGIKITGLRFYPSRSNKDDRKYGQMTLFYNPTYRTENAAGVKGDYAYALERNGNDVKPILLETIINGAQKQAQQVNGAALFNFSTTNAIITQSQAGDHGQINPPPSKDM